MARNVHGRGKLYGHPMYFDGEQWRFVDTAEPTIGARRACGHCGEWPTREGHDACLGTIPGVANACCGHGVTGEAYVVTDTGADLRGEKALRMFAIMGRGPSR